MPGDKKTLKFQMMMSPEEAKVLDDWMFENRVRSRAEAIRRLCQIGLAAEHIGSRTMQALGQLNEGLLAYSDALPQPGTTVEPHFWDYVANTGSFLGKSKDEVFTDLLIILSKIENNTRALEAARMMAKNTAVPVALSPETTAFQMQRASVSNSLIDELVKRAAKETE